MGRSHIELNLRARGADRASNEIDVERHLPDGQTLTGRLNLSDSRPPLEMLAGLLQQLGWMEDQRRIIDALAMNRAVHVRVCVDDARLLDLPWEELPVGGRLLGSCAHLYFTWSDANAGPPPEATATAGRVLLVSLGEGLPSAAQRRAIAQVRAGAGLSFEPETDALDQPAVADLVAALALAEAAQRTVAVLHLLAHLGPDGNLPFADGPCTGARLADALAPFTRSLRLVVLAICGEPSHPLSEIALPLHRSGLPCVVSGWSPLPAGAISQLTQSLYDALLSPTRPSSLEDALAIARRDLRSSPWQRAATFLRRLAFSSGDTRPFALRPYQALRRFDPIHHSLYFGRDAEADELTTSVTSLISEAQPRLMVVEGASGVGKASLISAGLLPRLIRRHDRRWLSTRMVPGVDPHAALDAALLYRPPNPAEGDLPLRWLLVVAHLEELFTHVTDSPEGRWSRDRFVRRLWSLASDPDGVAVVICTLRTGFRARCGELWLDAGRRFDQLFRPAMTRHHQFVPEMSASQLEAIIHGPLQVVGLQLDDGLDRHLLEDALRTPSVLPALTHTLDQLWLRRSGQRLTLEAYWAIGGVESALERHADAIIDALSAEDRQIARRMLVRLVHAPGETSSATHLRRPLDLLRREIGAAPAPFSRTATCLVDAALLVADVHQGRATLEIAHEALIRHWTRLAEWLSEDARRRLELERLARWQREGVPLEGSRLGFAVEVSRRYPDELPPSLERFIKRAVQTDDEASQQRLVREAGEAEERRRLEREAAYARDRARLEHAAHSETTLALAWLRECESPGDLPGWEEAVLNRWWRPCCPILLSFDPARATCLCPDPDGERLFVGLSDGTVQIVALDTGALLSTLRGHASAITAVATSPDGQHVASGCAAGKIRLWDPVTGHSVAALVMDAAIGRLAFSSTRLAAGLADGTIAVWDPRTGQLCWRRDGPAGEGPLVALGISPEGSRIAAARRDILIRDSRDGRWIGGLKTDNAKPASSLAFISGELPGARLAVRFGSRLVIWDTLDGSARWIGVAAGRGLVAVDEALLLGDSQGVVRLDPDDGRVQTSLETPPPRDLIPLGPDLLILHGDDRIRRWIAELDSAPSPEVSSARSLALTDGLLSIVTESTLLVWAEGELTRFTHPLGDGLLTASPSARHVWRAGSSGVHLWSPGSPAQEIRTTPTSAVTLSATGARALLVDTTGHLVVCTPEGAVLKTLETSPAIACAISDNHVATMGSVGTIRVWAIPSGAATAVSEGPPDPAPVMGFVGETTLAVGARSGSISLHDVRTGAEQKLLHRHTAPICALASASDLLVSGDVTGRIILWDVRAGDALAILGPLDSAVDTLALADDRVAALSAGRLHSWRLPIARMREALSLTVSPQERREALLTWMWCATHYSPTPEARRLILGTDAAEASARNARRTLERHRSSPTEAPAPAPEPPDPVKPALTLVLPFPESRDDTEDLEEPPSERPNAPALVLVLPELDSAQDELGEEEDPFDPPTEAGGPAPGSPLHEVELPTETVVPEGPTDDGDGPTR